MRAEAFTALGRLGAPDAEPQLIAAFQDAGPAIHERAARALVELGGRRALEQVLGYVAGGVLRGLLVGLIVTIFALFFTHLHVEHWFVVLAAVLLTSVVFSLGGFVNAVFAKNFDQITFVWRRT